MSSQNDTKKQPDGIQIESAISDVEAVEETKGKGETVRDWTDAEERRVVRRIDFRLLPMLCYILALSLIDRGNISAAYVIGMGNTLEMKTGSRYSVALLVFFITYGLFEIPSNLVIRRIGAKIWLSFLITAWGFSVFGMGFAHHWTTIVACRILLGLFEAGLMPGAIFILSAWYTKFEMARRMTIYVMMGILGNAFSGIFGYALSRISVGDGMYSEGWRWIYIVEGMLTICSGGLAFFFLGDFPERARWLTERQRHIAETRLALGTDDSEYHHVGWREALTYMLDWKIYIYCIMYLTSNAGAYSASFFMPIIISDGMGFDYSTTLLLTSPPWIFTIIMAIICAFLSDKYRIRWPVLVFQASCSIVGLLLILYTKPVGARLFGTFLGAYGGQANVPAVLTYATNNTPNASKRGVTSAMIITAGAVGGVIGGTIYRSQDAPLYFPGMWTSIGLQFVTVCLATFMTLHFRRKNRLADEGRISALEGIEGFRYTL